MINVSQIRQYMYCGMKLYHNIHTPGRRNDWQVALEIKKLKTDIDDFTEKNMRKIKKEMSVSEIESILSRGIFQYIENTIAEIRQMNLEIDSEVKDEIITDTTFNIKIKSLKLKQAMLNYDKNASEIQSVFHPNCFYSYHLSDEGLELAGTCDKVEIAEGKYYPVVRKNSTPPFKGVWDSDAVELAAYAMLLEEEFETDIYVGFVDYEKISQRRAVVMDVDLRKSLFKVVNEIREMINNNKMPEVKKSVKKCEKCEYKDICTD